MAATTFSAICLLPSNSSPCKLHNTRLSVPRAWPCSHKLGSSCVVATTTRRLLLMQSMAGLGDSTAASSSVQAVEKQKEAPEIVQEFYAAINRREVDSIGDLFAEDCVYEDLVFPKPFLGRQAVLEFFKKFMNSVGPELEFRVDDISTGDPNAAGVVWHLEWRGKTFPFSKGCSFYRCEIVDGKRQIKYGRDAVEPATKPGDFTLVALRVVAALLRRFPSLADKF